MGTSVLLDRLVNEFNFTVTGKQPGHRRGWAPGTLPDSRSLDCMRPFTGQSQVLSLTDTYLANWRTVGDSRYTLF